LVRKAVVVFATQGGGRGSLKGHEMGSHARQFDYILFSNKLFASIATRSDRKEIEKGAALSFRPPGRTAALMDS